MCFIEWQDGPCSPAKTSRKNLLCSNEGEKCFSQGALIPTMESSSSSYCTNLRGPTLVYFSALPDTSELSLCTTNSGLSGMLPFSFSSHLHLQFYTSLLSSHSWTCPKISFTCLPCWLVTRSRLQGILLYGSFRPPSNIFQFVLISFTFNWLCFEINFI